MNWVSIFIIFILFIVIDVPALMILNKLFYKNMFTNINQTHIVEPKRMYLSGLVVYLLMSIGIYVFVFKDKEDTKDIILKGMLLGFVLYGVYDITSLASIGKFGVKEACIDIIWGTILFGLVSYIFVTWFV